MRRAQGRPLFIRVGIAIAAMLAVMFGVTGAAGASTAAPAGVQPSYSRSFDVQADPHGCGHVSVHGWGTINYGATYLYLTGAKLKDDCGDGHSVKMLISAAGITRVLACYNSNGVGSTVQCHDPNKTTWTLGHVADLDGSPMAQLCVYNSTGNFCSKKIAI